MKHKLLSILLCLAMALSLLPTAALAEGETGTTGTIITTSEELVTAIENAQDGATITLGEGTFTTYDNASPKKSLTFVGSGTGTVWTIGNPDSTTGGESNGDYSFEGCDTITFENMTLKSDSANYRGFIRINNTIVDNCTIDGKTAYWGYDTATFRNGTIFNAPDGDYALWDYSSKSMTFDGCTFNISGKGVNVYVEADNADSDARKVEVKDCTVNSTSTKENKAFLNIKNHTQAYEVVITGSNTVSGLNADTTTGSDLYQVEDTTITETSGKPVKIQERAADGTLTTVYEVKAPAVAEVGGKEFTSLAEAFEALNETNHTLKLLDENAWNANTPVYWEAGTQSDYAATLTAALKAAYMENKGNITIVCRPGADVGTMSHGHVADNLTIYGNNAYLSGGECDLEVDTFKYSRDTGAQAKDGAYLDKNITITAYELDNLGVWGHRNTSNTVSIVLTDCDGTSNVTPNVQRVYINGTTGVNNITLINCDFLTKATAVYSNADGEVEIDNCSFTGSQVPVNFNHKANGTQTVTVKNSTFTNCGDEGEWKQFAAPIRFVNSGSGTSTTTVDNCTFNNTVGTNGDILIGDGRTGQASNDVSLTVKNTDANVQAQKPGYYNGESTDVTKMMAKQVAENERLETSVNELLPNAAKIGNTEYATLNKALESLSRTPEENVTIELLADQNVAGFTVDLSNSAIKTLTIQGNGKKLDSLVNGVDIDGKDGKPRCPVINAKLPADATFSVDGIVAPNSLLFDTGSEASLVVMNSTFNESQTGYPAAKNITYQGNTFEFKGVASKYYTNNAYPIWYKTENTTRSIAFLNNKVTGPRGFHIETRSTDADKHVNIKANGNTFNLSDSSDYKNKTIALQLVANLNGEIEFKDNQVNAYMGVCFFKGIVAQNDSKLTIQNNYTSGKLYGSSEWNTDGSTTEDRIAAADNFAREIVEGRKSANNGSAITEGHTHNYVNDKCTICGQTAPSYSGGSSSDPTYSVSTPSKTENGTVTVSPKRASKGDTVTVTVKPDSGYVLETLTVTDKNGNELTLKDKGNGKYTFTMPRSRVTIEATFAEIEEEPDLFFVDVPTSAYYYDAVYWVAENGVTYGTSATTFSPDVIVSRAQMVTFLWRAHGSPAPRSSVNPFTDITSDMYYYDAVLWAVENGVTNGISATTFSPDATVTRAQAVTFQWRAAGSPAVSGSSFADVADSAYYAGAVSWAVANGVTNGTGGSNFSPDVGVSRAQAVTFLWRQLAA